MKKIFSIIFFICCLTNQALSSSLSESLDFEKYGCFIFFARTPNVLYLSNDIDSADSHELRKALRLHPDIDIIFLNSPGGSISEGLHIAKHHPFTLSYGSQIMIIERMRL